MGEDLTLFRDLSPASTVWWTGIARHRRASLANGFVEACGVRCSYHGWLFGPVAPASNGPLRMSPHPEGPGSRDRISVKAYKVQPHAGLLWAYLGPIRRPWCRTGSRSGGRTASSRSCSPNCPAIGFSVRRTRSTRCTSNGSIPTGVSGWPAKSDLMRPDTFTWGSTSSRTAWSTFAFPRRHRRKPATYGPSAASACGRTRRSPARISNGGCRSTMPTTLSVTWMFARVPKEREPYVQETHPVLETVR